MRRKVLLVKSMLFASCCLRRVSIGPFWLCGTLFATGGFSAGVAGSSGDFGAELLVCEGTVDLVWCWSGHRAVVDGGCSTV